MPMTEMEVWHLVPRDLFEEWIGDDGGGISGPKRNKDSWRSDVSATTSYDRRTKPYFDRAVTWKKSHFESTLLSFIL
jgi:hypothetical protein